jgi:hypothetical protein
VKTPRPSNVTAIAVLVVLLAIASVLPQNLFTGLVEMGFVGLLAAELDRSGRHLALRIVRLVARLVPPERRSELIDEWGDHVLAAGEEGLRPLIAAFSVVRAAVAIGVHYRVRVYIAVRLLRGFGSCVLLYYALVSAMTKRRVPYRLSLGIAALATSWTVPVHMTRLSSRAWPMWLRIVLGAVVSISMSIGFMAFMRASVPVLAVRLSVEWVIFTCLGAISGSLIIDYGAVIRFAIWVGGKPIRDALAQSE